MALAPVVLFVYNRLEHTKRAIESLLRNELARESRLIIYSDSTKARESEADVTSVRRYIKTIDGFAHKDIIEYDTNQGPSKAIVFGVTKTIDEYGGAIVLEDDLVISPFFLKFMNDALQFYAHEERVISIGSYMYPLPAYTQQTLFLRIPDTWGWATWKRGWDLFEPDGKKLFEELKARKMLKRLNLDGAYNYAKMLRQQIEGKRDSWGIRWTASALLREKLTLYPSKSLIKNTGFDRTGINCGLVDGYETTVSQSPIHVSPIPIIENKTVVNAIKNFHRIRKLKSFIKACFPINRNKILI